MKEDGERETERRTEGERQRERERQTEGAIRRGRQSYRKTERTKEMGGGGKTASRKV